MNATRLAWTRPAIKHVARVRYGLGQPPPRSESGVAIIRATNVSRGRILAGDIMRAALEDLPLSRAPLLSEGEIIVVRSGAYTGDSAMVTEKWAGSAPGYDLRLTPEQILPRYLAYVLLGLPFAQQIKLASARAAQPHLNAEDLGEIRIDLPPSDEQRRIADFLDAETARIGGLEAARRRQVSLLRERMASRWSDQITDLAAAHGWIALRRFIVSITDGPFGSGLTSDHYSDEGARVIRLGNIGQAAFRDGDKAYIPYAYARQLGRHGVRAGDLLIAGLGDENYPLGRACVAPQDIGPAIVKADCFRVRLDQRMVNHEYAAWALSSPPVAQRVALLARGSTRARINLNVAREIAIPVPSLSKQAAACEALSKARVEVGAIERLCDQQLALLAERRQAVITAAVTGQLDPTTAHGVGEDPGASRSAD